MMGQNHKRRHFSLSFVALYTVIYLAINLPLHVNSKSSAIPELKSSTRFGTLNRKIQSFLIQHSAQTSRGKTRSNDFIRNSLPPSQLGSGSILTFKRPTSENICNWFGVDDEDPGNLRCMMVRRRFNHDAVGMTNPCIASLSSKVSCDKLKLTASSKRVTEVSITSQEERAQNSPSTMSSAATSIDQNSNWWPSLSFAPAQPREWRVLSYRKRVGNGMECYKRVRDAALDWEFTVQNESGDLDMGLLPVKSFPPKNDLSSPSLNSQIIRGRYTIRPFYEKSLEDSHATSPMYHTIGAPKRFVSFSSRRLLPFLPKIFSINPVMVVYDVVDQRGPATTFSSTAYATMRGHLLRGEERVTVALRDESDDVEVEIISISQAAPSVRGKVIWPFITKMQSTFFESQMHYLKTIGDESTDKGTALLSIPSLTNNRRF